MFLDHLKTNGAKTINTAIIEINENFKLELQMSFVIIKVAIPVATYKP